MDKTDKFATRLTQFLLSKRCRFVAACLLIVGICGFGASKLQFNTQYRYFFGPDNPELQEFDKLQKIYTKEDSIFVAIVPKDGTVFTNKTLAGIRELTRLSWKVPFSIRVDSITNYQHTEANEDDLTVGDLVPDVAQLTPGQIEKARQIALKDPIIADRLINKDGSMTAINISVSIPGKEPSEVPDTANYVRNMVKEWQTHYPDTDVYLSGSMMLNNAFVEAGIRDMSTLIPLMFLIIFVILLVFVRSFLSMIAVLIVVLLSVITGMGLAGWIGIPMTPPTSIAPVVILTLGIADSVHFFTTFVALLRDGMPKSEAIKKVCS